MDIHQIKATVEARLREESHASLEHVAEAIGMSQAGLQKLRLGHRPNPRFYTIAKLADYYQIGSGKDEN